MEEERREHKKGKPSDWELEAPFDMIATVEDLINAPPFKEASDEKGDSVTAGTRIPMWLHRRVVKLKEMPGSPYDVNSDVLRDAVYTGLQILHMRYRLGPDWDVERKMAAVVDSTGAIRRLKEQIEWLAGGLEELYEGGDLEQAVQRLSDYVLAAQELESKWHRDKVFRLLRESRTVRELTPHCSGQIQKLMKEEGK